MGLFGSATHFWFHFGFKGKAGVALMFQCGFVALFDSATHGLRIFISIDSHFILVSSPSRQQVLHLDK